MQSQLPTGGPGGDRATVRIGEMPLRGIQTRYQMPGKECTSRLPWRQTLILVSILYPLHPRRVCAIACIYQFVGFLFCSTQQRRSDPCGGWWLGSFLAPGGPRRRRKRRPGKKNKEPPQTHRPKASGQGSIPRGLGGFNAYGKEGPVDTAGQVVIHVTESAAAAMRQKCGLMGEPVIESVVGSGTRAATLPPGGTIRSCSAASVATLTRPVPVCTCGCPMRMTHNNGSRQPWRCAIGESNRDGWCQSLAVTEAGPYWVCAVTTSDALGKGCGSRACVRCVEAGRIPRTPIALNPPTEAQESVALPAGVAAQVADAPKDQTGGDRDEMLSACSTSSSNRESSSTPSSPSGGHHDPGPVAPPPARGNRIRRPKITRALGRGSPCARCGRESHEWGYWCNGCQLFWCCGTCKREGPLAANNHTCSENRVAIVGNRRVNAARTRRARADRTYAQVLDDGKVHDAPHHVILSAPDSRTGIGYRVQFSISAHRKARMPMQAVQGAVLLTKCWYLRPVSRRSQLWRIHPGVPSAELPVSHYKHSKGSRLLRGRTV